MGATCSCASGVSVRGVAKAVWGVYQSRGLSLGTSRSSKARRGRSSKNGGRPGLPKFRCVPSRGARSDRQDRPVRSLRRFYSLYWHFGQLPTPYGGPEWVRPSPSRPAISWNLEIFGFLAGHTDVTASNPYSVWVGRSSEKRLKSRLRVLYGHRRHCLECHRSVSSRVGCPWKRRIHRSVRFKMFVCFELKPCKIMRWVQEFHL